MAVPKLDAPLAEYSTTFNTLGTANPTDFGLSAAQMAQYTPLHEAYIAAYNAAKGEGSKNKALVYAKDTAKRNLLVLARELYAFVQANNSVSDQNKALIGVRVKDVEPTPVAPPQLAPLVTLISVTGRTAKFRLSDAQFPNARRRPPNAEGATILSSVGPIAPPSGDPAWKLEGQVGRNTFYVEFPADVPAGTPCWVTAVWYTRRGQYSPATPAVQCFLQSSASQQSA